MSTLLYIDTSAATATIALSADGRLLAERRHHNAQEQAAVINLLIETVLETAQLSLQEVSALCVCAGPGSYTGLRVGLSTAKGIAYALNKPLMLFNKLELVAQDFLGQHTEGPVTIALKARMGEYFAAAYDQSGKVLLEPQHIFEAALGEVLAHTTGLLVTDSDIACTAGATATIATDYGLNVNTWMPLATARFEAAQFDDLAYSEPFYLKAAFTTQAKK